MTIRMPAPRRAQHVSELTPDEKFLLNGLLRPDERVVSSLRWGGEPYRITWVATTQRLVFLERQSRVYRVDDTHYATIEEVRTFHEPTGSRIRLRSRGLRYGLDGLPQEAVEEFARAVNERLALPALRTA